MSSVCVWLSFSLSYPISLGQAPGESGWLNRWNLPGMKMEKHLAPLQIWSAAWSPQLGSPPSFQGPQQSTQGRELGLKNHADSSWKAHFSPHCLWDHLGFWMFFSLASKTASVMTFPAGLGGS